MPTILAQIYLAITIVSLITFILYFLRINEYLAEKGLRCTVNKDTIICLIYCFIPLLHLRFGHECYKLVVASDEEFREFFESEDEL